MATYGPGPGNDTLMGGEEDDLIHGGSGDDSLDGGNGNDTLTGGEGDDTLTGGGWDDTFVWNAGIAAGHDTLTDLEPEESLSFRGVTLTRVLAGDDPSALQVGEVMVGTPSAGSTMLHVRLHEGAGGLASITLAGAFDHTSFALESGADSSLRLFTYGLNPDGDGEYDDLEGGNGDEVIKGSWRGGYIDGDEGDDTLTGGGGSDWFFYDADGTDGRDRIRDLGGSDNLFVQGIWLDTTIRTTGDASTLDVGQVLVTSAGDLTLVQARFAAGDEGVLTIELEGNDYANRLEIVNSGSEEYPHSHIRVIYVPGTGEVYQGSVGNDSIAVRGSGNDTLLGFAGNDLLDGGDGEDVLRGGDGNDVYRYGVGDDVDELAGGGIDTVITKVHYSAAEDHHVENLRAGYSTRTLRLTGNALDNILTGSSGANVLDGGAGADTLRGGDGKDTYYLDNAGDDIDVESSLSAGGADTVITSVDYVGSSDYVETLTAAAGIAAIDLTGNVLANRLTGNAGINVLAGAAGADTLDGAAGADFLQGGEGNDIYYLDNAADDIQGESSASAGGIDTVFTSVDYSASRDYVENLTAAKGTARIDLAGNQRDNILTGNDGRNILNGRAGADVLLGGLGDDTYYLDDAGDNISGESSLATGGIDNVISSIDWSASRDYVENLTAASGTAGVDLTGNQLANLLTGNSGVNDLSGLDGADTLDGAGGADVLRGGEGNDTYYLDNAGDNISGESSASAGGIDTVIAGVDYSASSDYIEHLKAATGTASVDLTGNQLANKLTGNAGSNVLVGGEGADTLDGGAAADTMSGGRGDDLYFVHNKADVVIESSSSLGGVDTVISTVHHTLGDYQEHLVLTGSADLAGAGNALANVITGNAGANKLAGGGGADRLFGGAGADVLNGGSGSDRFVFLTTSDSSASAHDTIADFVRGADRIDLLKLDANTASPGVDDWSFIGSAAFSTNATGQLRYAYDNASGSLMLYGSTDADRTAEFALEVSGVTQLGASDFIL
ncbi:MAG TPA: M10 family metallopeptidase C-terminal domain-containing protein [Ramlibacter sp.]|jgi:Ca2+-binding RTX toxin-like protein